MDQETTTSPSTSSATSSTTSFAASSSGSSASSTHIIIIVTAVIFGTLALILMSVFGFVFKKRGLRRTKSNDFEKNNPYQTTSAHKKAMSTANLPSFAWERTTKAPAELAIAAQNEQSKTSRNRRLTVSQDVNTGTNPAQGSTQSFTPLLGDVDNSNVTTSVMSDPHRRAQSAGDNLIAYITYNDPGFTSNHQLRSTGLVPLQIERQPSPPSPLVSKHGSLHSITTYSGTSTTPSSGPNSSTGSRPSTCSASTSQKVMTSSLPPPLPPSICIQPHTPVVERSDEQHHEKPEGKVSAYEPFKGSSAALPTPPVTPSFSSRPSSSCSVNTTAASHPAPSMTSSVTMPSASHLPPSLRPGNAGNRSTLALPVPAAAHDGSNSTASKRLSTASTVSTRRRTLSNPLHVQLHLQPLQQLAPAPATASHSHSHHSRSRSTGRDSTASNGSGASSSTSSTSSSSTTPSVNSNNGSNSSKTKSKHGKRLSSFDAHRLSEQTAAREWAQARARSRSASRSSVVPSGAERYYAGSSGNDASATDLPAAAAAAHAEVTATANGSGAAAAAKKEGQGEEQEQDPSRLSAEGHGQGESKTRRRTISGDWLRRGRDRGAGASIGALISTALC